jgi:hypothetical protein
MLTDAQKATLKANILAIPEANAFYEQGDLGQLANYYNALASPDFKVWRTSVDPTEIFDTISWDKYTPVDAADSTVLYSNRLLAIQTKQMNLQNMLIGRSSVDASKANVRAGLRDATIQLPAGAGGAFVTATGASAVTLLTVCTRNATRLEKLLTLGPQTTGTVTAGIMGFEGAIYYLAFSEL